METEVITFFKCPNCGMAGKENGRVKFFACGDCYTNFVMHVAPLWVAEIITEYVETKTEIPDNVAQYLSTIGKNGGKIGGPARAAKLPPKRRKQIAQQAANARWEKKVVVDPLSQVITYTEEVK